MKIGAIINPKSGGGETFKVWKKIKVQALQRLGPLEEIITRSPQEATGLARQLAKNNFDLIMIMGGDGTIHEVINGLIDSDGRVINPKLKLGIINSGRGCDFIKSLHLPTDPRESLSIVVDGRTRKVDVGCAKIWSKNEKAITRYFINSFSYGLGGDVAKDITSSKTMLPAGMSYFIRSSFKFFTARPYGFKVFVGDEKKEVKGPFINFFACNGRFSGGGMYWAPQAQVDDGKLDLVLVRDIPKWKLALIGHKIYDGSFQSISEVSHESTHKIHVTSAKPLWVEMDGEVLQAEEFELTVVPRILEFMVP